MNKIHLHILCILFLLLPFTLSANEQNHSDAMLSAQQFLAAIDRADYAASWDQSSDILKRIKPLNRYLQEQNDNLFLYGKAQDRYSLQIKDRKSMAKLPDGEYILLVYRTRFERKAEAWELVTILKEADGQWRVVNYDVR